MSTSAYAPTPPAHAHSLVPYDVPTNSNKKGYNEAKAASADFPSDRERLGAVLVDFIAIEQVNTTGGFANTKSKNRGSK